MRYGGRVCSLIMLARTIVTLLVTALLHCDSFLMAPSPAVIIPTDALVFIGETLIIECLLKTSNTSPSDMYFAIQPRVNQVNDTWNISQQDTIIGPKNITTELEITSRYSHYTTVFCKDNNERSLKTAAIRVEYPIKNITNLKGTAYFDNATIILTWSLGETYLDLSSIKVEVNWSAVVTPNLEGSDCTSSDKEFCAIHWQLQPVIFIRFKISHLYSYNRQLDYILKPLYETSATLVYEFHAYDYLKTGPPESLKVENVTNTCVMVRWEDSSYFHVNPFTNTIYRIEVKTDDEPEFRVVVDNDMRSNSSEAVSICELIPFTKYSLSVQLRAKDINPWSDRTIVRFATEEDRPLTGPPITDTSYQVGDCVNNKRDAFVYWKDPSKESLRGHLVRFEVDNNNTTTKLLRPAYNYFTDSIDCDFASKIRVYSATSVGPSLVPSEMYIPKQSDELTLAQDLMFRLEVNSDDGRSTSNITIKWDPGDLAGDIKIIVYMCAETYVPNTCFNDFKTIEANISDKEIQLTDIPSTTNLFGYAVKDNRGRKQGIQWTSCVYRTDTKLDKPTGLHVIPGSQANSLEISWTSSQCIKSKKVLVLRYYLLICKLPLDKYVDGKCLNITFSDFSIHNYTATSLEGGQMYYVYIQAESYAGLGVPSDAKEGVPRIADDSGPDARTIVGSTMGTVLGVIFMGSMIFCFVKHCKKSSKRINELQKKIQPVQFSEVITRQTSDDSGNCTGSDPNGSNESRPVPPPPIGTHDEQLNACPTPSTLSSVIAEIPVDKGAAPAACARVPSMDLDDSESSPSYMKHGNANLQRYKSHPVCARPAQPCTRVDAAQLHTSSESDMEMKVFGGADVDIRRDCAIANTDMRTTVDVVDTNSSSSYMLFTDARLIHPVSQPTEVLNADLDAAPNNSSANSGPMLQLGEKSHLPHIMQKNPPRQDIILCCTRQVNGQIAPEREDNSQSEDYVRSTDGNINCQTEHCRPDTGSVVTDHIVMPSEFQALLHGRIRDQNTLGPSVEDINSRTDLLDPHEMLLLPQSQYQTSNSSQEHNGACLSVQEDCCSNIRTDRIVPQQSVLPSEFQSVPDHRNRGQNASGSNVPENHLNYCDVIDDLPAESDGVYIRRSDVNSENIGDDDDGHESNGSFNSSTCSLAQNDFNIDDLISNRSVNNGRSLFNMQSDDNPHITTDEHFEVSNGSNEDMITEFRNDLGRQDDGNVREDSQVSDSDHHDSSADYDPQALLPDSQSDSFEYEDSEEASQDVELSNSRQRRAASAENSGYAPLSCLDTYSSSDGSDVSQNSSSIC
ncbi:hypothetical protein BsWGS_02484 [Bradybaena similaris]